jgi:UDP-N-acetylmuramate--alanine ligase
MVEVFRKMNDHYHFIGIGGIGMGALASILLSKGKKVTGTDIKENQITRNLTKQGAKIYFVHDASNIGNASVVIYSSAIDFGNIELLAAKASGKVIIKRAQLLAELIKEYVGITVAGAHGKTTTTSMISHLLTTADLKPTTAVGGILNDIDSNAQLGKGEHFVAEVDESDGSFLFFHSKYSVITNIDIEHLDHYKNLDNIIEAYRKFIDQTESDGIVIGCGDDNRLNAILKNSGTNYKTYGFSYDNNIIASDLKQEGFTTTFTCLVDNKVLGEVSLSVPGRHNVLNSLACIGMGLTLGIEFSVIQTALKTYQGVRRRFQVLGNINDVLVVDDYAHHPTEIKTVVETASLIKKNRLITIFQPHRYSRLKYLMDDFVTSLKDCDYLIITDVYAASEQPLEGVSSKVLYEKIRKLSHKPVFYLPIKDLLDYVLKLAKPGDLIMTLGAGDITQISTQIAKQLVKKCQDNLEVIG